MRGEQPYATPPSRHTPGPSPRARGAGSASGTWSTPVGTIPACAGSRDARWVSGLGWQGPSPRARGADQGRRGHSARPGTIPACAGSSSAAARSIVLPRDHPRVRGAGRDAPHPPARGGTIPACAGSSRQPTGTGRRGRDHPRVRGEQSAPVTSINQCKGPSPRARGAADGASGRPRDHVDHPRVRGEQDVWGGREQSRWGPSPRARGAARSAAARDDAPGTIPACAGSRDGEPEPAVGLWDHPRVRGEQWSRAEHPCGDLGPSPRARGAVSGLAWAERIRGTIPACAGSRLPDLRVYQRQGLLLSTSLESDIAARTPFVATGPGRWG